MSDLTFSIIKPDAYSSKPQIESQILAAGFNIIGIKYKWIGVDLAKEFYKEHQDKDFFNNLIQFMTSGPVVVYVLQKPNAVENFRTLIGNTNPKLAEVGTIRNKFGTSVSKNAIHGADSDASVIREIFIFFPELMSKINI